MRRLRPFDGSAVGSVSGREDGRLLVVGCGSIGRRHLRNLIDLGVRRILAYDPSEERRRQVGASGVETVEDLDTAWTWGPSVVLVCSPTSMHVSTALAAAERGCDLFVEKALTNRVDQDLRRLVRTVSERGLVTLVGCNMRFHPGPRGVKRLIDRGAIGNPLFARLFGGSYLPDWHPEEDYRRGYSASASLGGGCVLDGIHEIDLARWYLGEVRSVAALTSRTGHLDIEVEDLASLILEHENDAHSEVHLDYVQRVRIRGCVIAGTEGTVMWEWSDGRIRHFDALTGRWHDEPLPAAWDVNEMYRDEMAHFLDCVSSHRDTVNPVREAAVVTAVALAGKRASAERRMVDVNELYGAKRRTLAR